MELTIIRTPTVQETGYGRCRRSMAVIGQTLWGVIEDAREPTLPAGRYIFRMVLGPDAGRQLCEIQTNVAIREGEHAWGMGGDIAIGIVTDDGLKDSSIALESVFSHSDMGQFSPGRNITVNIIEPMGEVLYALLAPLQAGLPFGGDVPLLVTKKKRARRKTK